MVLTCLGDVLLALGGAVNDALDSVLANVINLSLDAGSLLLLGHTCALVLYKKAEQSLTSRHIMIARRGKEQ